MRGTWLKDVPRVLRYAAPSLVTTASLVFGLLSIVSSVEGRFYDAAWFIIFSVLTDKLDGFVARLLRAATEFGVQMDSFADFLNFGIAPATLFYAFLTHTVPFQEGQAYWLLVAACLLWVLGVTFRLARYNVVEDDPRCRRIFFGVPTTLMGGTLAALFLTGLKYGPPELAELAGAEFAGEPRLFPGLTVPLGFWTAWPVLVLLGAYLMASSVKIPKLGMSRFKAFTVFVFANVVAGYALGFARLLPEYMVAVALLWIGGSLVWGFLSKEVRQLKPPPLFPRAERPVHELPQRPEDDLLPEGDAPCEDEGGDVATPATRSS